MYKEPDFFELAAAFMIILGVIFILAMIAK